MAVATRGRRSGTCGGGRERGPSPRDPNEGSLSSSICISVSFASVVVVPGSHRTGHARVPPPRLRPHGRRATHPVGRPGISTVRWRHVRKQRTSTPLSHPQGQVRVRVRAYLRYGLFLWVSNVCSVASKSEGYQTQYWLIMCGDEHRLSQLPC